MSEINNDEKQEIVDKLLEEHPIHEMVKFNEMDIQEKLKDNSFNIVKYRDLYDRERAKYEELEDKYNTLVGMRYDHYRFDYEKELQKPEIERYYLPKDKKIIQMKNILRKQEIRMRFFELCIKGFESQGWRMKSFLDSMRGGL